MLMVYLEMIDTPEERSKFEVLYGAYKGLMYHVAYLVLENNEDAEDAVHEAFVRVAENMDKIDEPVSPRTKSYLITIVENKAIDIHRSNTRHTTVEYNEETVGLSVEYLGSFDEAKCLAKLTPKYRNVLLWKYCHGYTNKEIAKILGTSELYVKNLVHRARERLSEMCKEEGLL